ncbi:hypothetical protein PanWU01x14_304500 [Parasponia andersonii]|uniref:Uncharacterized protein n=1 Tax=Parasponia andersonii TaxID=3476 RepID=A0A2P5ASH5_PARAD|nr:hypothetical protein PanWU01x14_304500 [Parasponia andersonii]
MAVTYASHNHDIKSFVWQFHVLGSRMVKKEREINWAITKSWAYYGPSFGPAFVSAGAGTHEPMQIQAQARRFTPPVHA